MPDADRLQSEYRDLIRRREEAERAVEELERKRDEICSVVPELDGKLEPILRAFPPTGGALDQVTEEGIVRISGVGSSSNQALEVVGIARPHSPPPGRKPPYLGKYLRQAEYRYSRRKKAEIGDCRIMAPKGYFTRAEAEARELVEELEDRIKFADEVLRQLDGEIAALRVRAASQGVSMPEIEVSKPAQPQERTQDQSSQYSHDNARPRLEKGRSLQAQFETLLTEPTINDRKVNAVFQDPAVSPARKMLVLIVCSEIARGSDYRSVLQALDECDETHHSTLFRKYHRDHGISCWTDLANDEKPKKARANFQSWLSKQKKAYRLKNLP